VPGRNYKSLSIVKQAMIENRTTIAIAALVLVFVCITMIMSYKMNIWLDEAYSMHTTGSTWTQSVKLSASFEEQPPAYFCLLCLWRHMNRSILFARILSILCVLTAGFFMVHLKNSYTRRGSVLLLLLFLTNPLTIWAATEIRVYGLSILLSSILLWSFHAVFVIKSRKLRDHALFLTAAVISVFTQYFMGYLLVVNVVFLILVRDWGCLWRYLAYLGVILTCFMPFYLQVTIHQVHDATVSSSGNITLMHSLHHTAQLFLNLILPGNQIQRLPFMISKISLLVSAMLAFLTLRNVKHSRSFDYLGLWALLTITLGIPAFAFLLYKLGDEDLLEQRYIVFLLPEMLLLILFLFKNIRHSAVRNLLVTAFILYNIVNSSISYYPMKKKGDWKEVAQFVKKRVQSDEPIFIYFSANVLPFSYYFHLPNKIIPIPRPPELRKYNPSDFVIEDVAVLDSLVTNNFENAESCWFVINSVEYYRNLHFNAHLLPEFIGRHFPVIEYQRFSSTEIYHASKRKDPY
jgi:hypothetical protein